MKKFDVQIALEGLAEARGKWTTARNEFDSGARKVFTRLLHEAAANYMSAEEVARAVGYTPKRVRVLMREAGLNPRDGKTLLAKTAAEALATNADLLGVAPHEVDLMSPLAYLPMGSELRQALTDATTSQVTDLPVRGWFVHPVTQNQDVLFEVYNEEDDFIATFENQNEAEKVCALWNNQ